MKKLALLVSILLQIAAVCASDTSSHHEPVLAEKTSSTALITSASSFIKPIEIDRVLNLGGGGPRGVNLLVFLAALEKKTGKSIHEMFDLIVGTSIGGILAKAFALPKSKGSKEPKYTATSLMKKFKDDAKSLSGVGFSGLLKAMLGVKESVAGEKLEEYLKAYFGDWKLSDCLIPVAITYNDASEKDVSKRGKYFTSWGEGKDLECWKVARATSCLPFLFGPFYSEGKMMLDGGIGDTVPVLSSLEILEETNNIENKPFILALGTGAVSPTSHMDNGGFLGLYTKSVQWIRSWFIQSNTPKPYKCFSPIDWGAYYFISNANGSNWEQPIRTLELFKKLGKIDFVAHQPVLPSFSSDIETLIGYSKKSLEGYNWNLVIQNLTYRGLKLGSIVGG